MEWERGDTENTRILSRCRVRGIAVGDLSIWLLLLINCGYAETPDVVVVVVEGSVDTE